jgi:hypothetical protein
MYLHGHLEAYERLFGEKERERRGKKVRKNSFKNFGEEGKREKEVYRFLALSY